tara:strand:- start:2342 stop:2773 length:432 start_codon:yes stop_codon:yes gene_type:complete
VKIPSKKQCMNFKTRKIKVRYSETDQMGIVHHSNYLKFFELARIEWLDDLGMPYDEIENNNIILPVVKCDIHFLSPLKFGDLFYVIVYCTKQPMSSIEFKYEICLSKNNKIITRGNTKLAFLNSNSMKPIRCPDIIGDLFLKV